MSPDDIERARVQAAEDIVIAGIPQWMLDNAKKADAKFKAAGGCKGCGSQVIGVHTYPCSYCDEHPFD
jgi:hypothetical protein